MAGQIGSGTASDPRTPEELETLFEDALLVHDGAMLAALFETSAVFIAGDEPPLHGHAAITRRLLARRDGERSYIADPQRILQARDLALVVAERGIAVMRRGSDDAWRYAIVLLALDGMTAKEEP